MFQVVKISAAGAVAGDCIAQRRGELVQDGGPAQEILHLFRLAVQRLFDEVIKNMPVRAAE